MFFYLLQIWTGRAVPNQVVHTPADPYQPRTHVSYTLSHQFYLTKYRFTLLDLVLMNRA